MGIMGALGKLYQRVRTVLGLTQSELADRLGVGLATVSRWETGAHAPVRGDVRQRLHRELRIPADVASLLARVHEDRIGDAAINEIALRIATGQSVDIQELRRRLGYK